MDLSQYLSELDGQYRLYDVGRRIRKLDKQQFKQFEAQQSPYPFPYLQHAWLALYVSQPNQPANETLWFLKWPLDEQGKIIPYVRDDLVARLMRLSEQPLKVDSEIDDPLKDNPFAFNPDDTRRANLHAMINSRLRRSGSQFYEPASNYLKQGTLNASSLENWKELGMQGIADVASRIDQHLVSLKACLPNMPKEVYLAFSQCLEHQSIPHELALAVWQRFEQDLKHDNRAVAVEAGMRILGACFSDELRIQAWQAWFNSDYAMDMGCLLAFSTRNYDDLAFMPQSIETYLVNLANLNGGDHFEAFIKIVSDLLFLPGIRNLLLNALRNENRPEILGHAMQALLTSKQQS